MLLLAKYMEKPKEQMNFLVFDPFVSITYELLALQKVFAVHGTIYISNRLVLASLRQNKSTIL